MNFNLLEGENKTFSIFFNVLIINLIILFILSGSSNSIQDSDNYLICISNPKTDIIETIWKDEKGKIINDFYSLIKVQEAKNMKVNFIMNGGMFMQDYSPLGLYIEKGKTLKPVNLNDGYGNFYLKPNGVFFIKADSTAGVCKSEDFPKIRTIRFATQSGPMLLIDGEVHQAFTKGSKNLNIRNGVGIRTDGKIIFALSKVKVNLYEFAEFFKENGCKSALYLDGFVSRAYYPAQNWVQTDGKFGVMIAISERKK